ncbi:MAG: hypothetical protein JJU31_09550 [Wenzhouxiangella sp.]|nr:hypothetical protein [Wenzhouxiangella sp.]
MTDASVQRKTFSESVLAPVLDEYKRKEQALCGFMAMKGCRYNHELMVVGRAVNAWGAGKKTIELKDAEAQREFIGQIHFPDSVCQMAWVSECAGNSKGYLITYEPQPS